MNSINSFLVSNNPYVEFLKETMPLVFAAILLYLYYKKRITALDTVLYAFATEAYTMLMIGPTFTATFFISIIFFIDHAHQLITGKTFIRKKYLLLMVLPALSSFIIFLIIQLYKDPFYYPPGKSYTFYIRPFYFYFKTYLPFFAIGAKIIQERDQLSFAHFSDTMKRIAKISVVIALVQILTQFIFKSVTLGEILGLQRRYLVEQSSSLFSLRVQAFFAEPKVFSAFLSLVIPLFVKDRQYKMAGIAFIMGILTVSQTFWINLVAGLFTFWLLAGTTSVRVKALGSVGLIIGIFLTVAASRNYFIKLYSKNQHNPMYQLVFKRSVYRYDIDIWGGKSNIVLGMPLQRDMELPVVDFLKDEPYLLLSGYGPGNSTFIPSQYFFGQLTYENHLNGIGGHNLNMRWFYLLAEFGALGLLCFFLVLTQTQSNITAFQRNYLAFVWVCFFFSQIDLFLMIVALLCAYETDKQTGAQA